MKTEDVLAEDWGRTNEEPGLALPRDEDGFGRGTGGSQLHQNDNGCRGSAGHRRVHDNAKLAVIGIGAAGVEMGYLGNSQKCKQDKAYRRDDRYETLPAALIPAGKCLYCCQSDLAFLSMILPKGAFLLDD